MKAKGISSLDFACHDPHNPPETNNLHQEVSHRIRRASKDQNIDHECHLYVSEENDAQLVLNFNLSELAKCNMIMGEKNKRTKTLICCTTQQNNLNIVE